ncbi:hypothetical protein PFISCL1PPCAC_18834, partial [Pristionchus fissidentatus]
ALPLLMRRLPSGNILEKAEEKEQIDFIFEKSDAFLIEIGRQEEETTLASLQYSTCLRLLQDFPSLHDDLPTVYDQIHIDRILINVVQVEKRLFITNLNRL